MACNRRRLVGQTPADGAPLAVGWLVGGGGDFRPPPSTAFPSAPARSPLANPLPWPQVLQSLSEEKKKALQPMELRKLAREFALETVSPPLNPPTPHPPWAVLARTAGCTVHP